MTTASSRSISFSTAASRASVSRFPSPASTRMRVLSLSSSVRFPELPEASMETRNPMCSSPVTPASCQPSEGALLKTFPMMAEPANRVNAETEKFTGTNPSRELESRCMDEHDEKPESLDRYFDPKLETLGELLDQLSDDGAMDLEELDGFFAALHCCPQLVPPTEYLPEVLGTGEFSKQDEFFKTPEAAKLLFGLLMEHWNAVGDAFRN